jgi:phosphocarrier protein HPr
MKLIRPGKVPTRIVPQSTPPVAPSVARVPSLVTMPVVSKNIVICNKDGLHARPAMQLVDLANQFQCNILIKKGGDDPFEADGKSVMQVMILAATEGTELTLEAEGEDADSAVAQIAELVANRFGAPE